MTAPSQKEWTEEEESALVKLEAESVAIKETALDCLKELHKQELIFTIRAMSSVEKKAFIVVEEEKTNNALDKRKQEDDGDK